MADAWFSTATLDFLQDLEVHNDRSWFEANRDRWEADVRGPVLRFVADLQAPLRTVSRHVVADPRPVGGSMFRIHRDLRFSSDPTPYKTHVGAQFRHEAARDAHAPGYYLHLEPGNCGMAAGIWHPPTAVLTTIRQAIVDAPGAWTRMRNTVLADGWELSGTDRLTRPPRGFDADAPHVEDLKLRSFAVWHQLDEDEVVADDFLDRFVEHCRHARPLMRHVCRALGLAF